MKHLPTFEQFKTRLNETANEPYGWLDDPLEFDKSGEPETGSGVPLETIHKAKPDHDAQIIWGYKTPEKMHKNLFSKLETAKEWFRAHVESGATLVEFELNPFLNRPKTHEPATLFGFELTTRPGHFLHDTFSNKSDAEAFSKDLKSVRIAEFKLNSDT